MARVVLGRERLLRRVLVESEGGGGERERAGRVALRACGMR